MKTTLKFAEFFALLRAPKQYFQRKDLHHILTPVLGLSLLSLTGCAHQYRILTDWYSPPNIARLSNLKPIAVYLLTDNREEDDTQVGVSGFETFSALGTTSRANAIYVSEPVAVTVTQAFADGLRARGFPVIDMTKTRLDARASMPEGPVALSGEIVDLRYEQWRPLFDDLHGRAQCRVILQAYDPKSERKFWEKEYAKTHTFGPRQPEREPKNKSPLGQVVAEVVAEAVYDPEMILAIGRKRNLGK